MTDVHDEDWLRSTLTTWSGTPPAPPTVDLVAGARRRRTATVRRRAGLGVAAVVVVVGAAVVPVAVHAARGHHTASISSASPCDGTNLRKVGTVLRGAGRAGRPVELRLRHLTWNVADTVTNVEFLVADRGLAYVPVLSDPDNPDVLARLRTAMLPSAVDISFVPPAAGEYTVYVTVVSTCARGSVSEGEPVGSVRITR